MTSGFPLSGGPLSEAGPPLPPLPPPPPPGLLPEYVFSSGSVKMAFTEDSVSRGLNQRWLGMPRGVYMGFRPVVVGADVVELRPDENEGVSLLKVGSSQIRGMIDIVTQDAVTLNFAGHTQFPVYIIARADYAAQTTSAKVFTRSLPASGHNEVQIGLVNRVGDDLVVSAVEPLERQLPVAFTGQPFGYMAEGAVEDLQTANASIPEVVAARVDLTTTTQLSLADRIAADMNGASMADRLALRVVHLESDVYTLSVVDVPITSLNVSGSFSAITRSEAPFLDLSPLGSSTVEGVISAPNNTTENVCPVVNAESGERIETATRELIYARLDGGDTSLTGSAAFVVASPFVSGVGTVFGLELEEGDLIRGPDGRFYEVETISSNTLLELTSGFQGISSTSPSLLRRRYKANFYSTASGAESPVIIETPQSIKFFFGAWLRTDVTSINAFSIFRSRAARPEVANATKTLPGKTLLRDAGSLTGGIRRVRSGGIAVASNPHTLNFVVPGSVTDLGNGECAVSVVGETGPIGDPGPVGPTGDPGEPGLGIAQRNYRILSGPSGTTIGAAGPVTLTHTVDFSTAPTPMTRVDHLTGGLGYFKDIRSEIVEIDYIAITDYATTRVTGEIRATITPSPSQTNSEIKLFLGAFGV